MQLKLLQNSKRKTIGYKQSIFKGQGLKFKDHQVYSFGDDIRFIDWKVTAKTKIPHVKVFEEEKNQGVDIFVDASKSMEYGCNRCSKFEAAIQILCLFYLWSDLTKDKIRGVILCDDLIDLPKTSGKVGIGFLLQMLLKKRIIDEKGHFNIFNSLPVNDELRIEKNVEIIMKLREKKNHLVIISDFYNFLSDKCLQHLSLNNGGLNLIQIMAPLDIHSNEKDPIAGYFSNDNRKIRRSLYGYERDLFEIIKIGSYSNLYQINIGDKYYLEKFAQKIR